MTNPLNLGKHEVAQILADADEVAQFLSGLDPVSTEGCDELEDERDVLALHVHIVDGRGNIVEIEPATFNRWEKSIRTLSQMVVIE